LALEVLIFAVVTDIAAIDLHLTQPTIASAGFAAHPWHTTAATFP
jgi:hypothetical protein